jgi:hypothetical protein
MVQILSIFGAILTIATLAGSAIGWLIGTFWGGWFVAAFGCVIGFAGGVAVLWHITSKWRFQ